MAAVATRAVSWLINGEVGGGGHPTIFSSSAVMVATDGNGRHKIRWYRQKG
jgi:hypothetical protein